VSLYVAFQILAGVSKLHTRDPPSSSDCQRGKAHQREHNE
jgi:hypothetical protein